MCNTVVKKHAFFRKVYDMEYEMLSLGRVNVSPEVYREVKCGNHDGTYIESIARNRLAECTSSWDFQNLRRSASESEATMHCSTVNVMYAVHCCVALCHSSRQPIKLVLGR